MSDQIAHSPASAEVAAAILATTRAVGTLGKAAVNPHGGYKYVSIDKFYETVARIASDNGLNWTLREVDFRVMPEVGKTGAVKATYEVDLIHASGCKLHAFSCLSVIHPIQGAQTVGSAMSYADKIFMRQTFKVSTGEKDIDADETDNSALDLGPSRPAKAERREKAAEPADDRPRSQKVAFDPDDADGEKVVACFDPVVHFATDSEMLKWAWSDNILAIEWLKNNHPDGHKRVVEMFTARKNELKKGK